MTNRVGAILNIDNGHVYLLGYGTREGEAIPIKAAGVIAECARTLQITSPKIVLDNGDVIYGCECWWAPEDEIKEIVNKAKKVTMVDIKVMRKG